MKGYKGFNKDMTCKNFQYEIGKEYETDKAQACRCGFHACEYPLDCFSYYAPSESRYCEVEQSGDISKTNNDTKVASTKIKIGAEIGIKGLIKAAFEYVKERCTNEQMGADNAALTGGYQSALIGGDWSALTGGNQSALTGGDQSALTGGYRSALAGGDWSALTGGYQSALTSGYRSALTGGDWSALTGGKQSALTGGDWSALTGGDWSALTGGDWSVVYGGEGSKLSGGLHSVLAVQFWKDGKFECIKFKEVDGEKIKPNTFYKLDKAGRFVEVKE